MARVNVFPIAIALILSAGIACVTDESTDDPTGDPTDDDGYDSVGSDVTINEPTYPTTHPRIYLSTNRTRLKASLDNRTPAATAFKSKVDAWVGGSDIWGFQAWYSALLGQLTGTASYCTKAIANVDAQVSAAEAKIAAGSQPDVAGDSYLGVGEMIGDVALVYDWCYGAVTSTQKTRWLKYANQAVWNVWHPTQAVWGSKTFTWSGWSVNNPSNNYYYSFLRATMLLGLAEKGESSYGDTWIAQFRQTKILDQLVPTFNADLVGGASREGTGYGVAMRRLWELYDFWCATTGEAIGRRTNHTRASMLAFIHQVVPTLDKVAPTGDQSRDSTAAFFDYHRNYLQELISLMPTDSVSGRARTLLEASSVPAMGSGFMVVYDFLYDRPDVIKRSLSALNTAYHARGIGELYARSDWGKSATWINLIAGPYTESHAHQDQGSLMIYKGSWLGYDAVIKSHSGLDQRTTAHSLVRIDSGGVPVTQVASTTSKLAALHQGPGYVYASADVTAAYAGKSAVGKVHREVMFLQPNAIVVFDRVTSASGTAQTWQLATPVQPSISGSSATITNAGHSLKVTRVSGGGAMSVYSYSADSDYSGGYRLDEKVTGGDVRYLHVLSLDGAVSSTASAGTTSQPGVTINLASGGSATVKFNRDAVGAYLTMNGTTITLGAGVDTLPN
jgi:hypothetical protein